MELLEHMISALHECFKSSLLIDRGFMHVLDKGDKFFAGSVIELLMLTLQVPHERGKLLNRLVVILVHLLS